MVPLTRGVVTGASVSIVRSTHTTRHTKGRKSVRMTPFRVPATAGAACVESSETHPASPAVGCVPGFLRRVAECNEITSGAMGMRYVPLLVAGQAVGLMMPEFAAALLGAGDDVFELRRGDDETNGGIGETTNGADGGDGADTNGKAYSNVITGDERQNLLAAPESMLSDSKKKKLVVTLDHANAMTAPQRTETVKPILERLKTQNVITGWRDELFPVNKNYGEPPLLLVERASASLLGIKAYGVHVNGFVSDPSNGRVSKIWVARRSATKQTFPGMLDHLVAGGLPANMDPGECCVKECEEEASIPLVLARKAQPVGLVTYSSNYKGCCKRDVLFCYDLELPYVMGLSPNPASLFAHTRLTLSLYTLRSDFVPQPNDGEVESFELLTVDVVSKLIANTKEFKPNVAVVLCDFFVRHGLVAPSDPGYVELVRNLRQ